MVSSLHVRVPDSPAWIPDSTLSIPDSRYWISDFVSGKLDSWFQSLMGFRIPWTVFRIFQSRRFRIPQAKILGIRNPDFLTCGESPGRTYVLIYKQLLQNYLPFLPLLIAFELLVATKFRKEALGLIFFKNLLWGAYVWRGLSTEGNLRFRID